jgi:glycosyltransferase involved in cell wall biosynthesis
MADIAGIPIMQTQQDNSPWWSKSNLKERLMSHIENNFARKTCKYTAAISIAVQEDVLRNTKLSKEEIPLIYNFMDSMPPTIVDRHKSINDEYIKIFMITRLNLKKKGLDIAVQIAKKLIERGKKRYQFIIVGDGFDRSKMEELVKIEKITPFFEFRGYQEDVYSQFKEAHIVLMPSRWEGFGITAAEAALSKVPVVASRIGGLQEVVIDNETGALCKVEDVNCFVQKIEMLTESDETYQSISKKAVIKAKERFNKTTIFNKYDIIYKKLVASANN